MHFEMFNCMYLSIIYNPASPQAQLTVVPDPRPKFGKHANETRVRSSRAMENSFDEIALHFLTAKMVAKGGFTGKVIEQGIQAFRRTLDTNLTQHKQVELYSTAYFLGLARAANLDTPDTQATAHTRRLGYVYTASCSTRLSKLMCVDAP